MGLHDRDYARAEDAGQRFNQPIRRRTGWRPSACMTLIFINLAIFTLWQVTQGGPVMQDHFTVSRENIFQHHYLHTLITAGFSDFGMMSFLLNMITLYFFGNMLEEEWGGPGVVWALYLSGTLGFSLTHLLMSFLLHWHTFGMGASGGNFALVVVAAILFTRRVVYFFGVIPMPLAVLALIYIGFDLLPLLQQLRNGIGFREGLGTEGHMGGVIAGVIFYSINASYLVQNWGTIFRTWKKDGGVRGTFRRWFRRKPKLRLVKPLERVPDDDAKMPFPKPDLRIVEHNTPVELPTASVDELTSERVDKLLKKISREGISALSADERKFLDDASKKYKK